MARNSLIGAIAVLSFLGAGCESSASKNAPPGKKPQPEASKSPAEFECRWAEKPIVIDGKGSDPAWKHAQTIDNFYLPWLGKNARPAKTKTKAKLLWDREYLYFFADMEDADLYADVKEHNGMLWDNDVFELFFKPSDNHAGYYEFQVNAAGAVLDLFLPRRGAGGYARFKNDTRFHVDAKVQLRGTLNNWTDRDDGWSVEGRIPWTDFVRSGGRPERDEKWKFALCRYDYAVDFEGPELSTCAPLSERNFHKFEDYATLRFVGPEKLKTDAPRGLEKHVPMTTSRVVGSPDPPPPYHVQRVYGNVPIRWPVISSMIPGSDEMLVLCLTTSYGTTRIQRMKDDPAAKLLEPWLSGTDTAYQLEFHPKFAENGYVYIGSNEADSPKLRKEGPKGPKKTRITRCTMDTKPPHKIVPGSEKVIIEWESDGHNGGAMVFGHDGMLYVTSGDGTSDSDTNLKGQDMSSLLGKVLRIDVDNPGEPGGVSPRSYGIPKDNPFVGVKDARPEIWALGLRNPWRICVDKKTGHLWVGNNGQDLWEQAYLVQKGDNYGWSVMEGSHPFYLIRKKGPGPFVRPTVEHHHSEARSLTGGLVYYGRKYPDLVGAYIYGDYSTGKVWAVKAEIPPAGGPVKVLWHKEIADTRLTITGFGTDRDGEILISNFTNEGGLYALVPNRARESADFPRKLSTSGLFKSVKGHVMEPSLLPYSVNAVLWSDGAAKERWLGLPAGGKIEFTTNRGWNFPDKTVIVKSFFVETEQGRPESRRWIETRFLTKQGPEWFGYSYAWNDEQDEGELIGPKGGERELTIKVPRSKEHPDGVKKLSWHFPSRAECMVCHSRAANWVLGFTELQMNKEHEYVVGTKRVRENQLAVFERLGLLQVNWAREVRELERKQLADLGKTNEEMDALLRRRWATRDQRSPAASSLLTRPPEKSPRLVDPYDAKQDLTLRARSYLHSNCAQCHVEAGGGNAQMELEFTRPKDKMRVIDVKPQHDTFGLKDAKLIAPGRPESSVLLKRIAQRDRGHMPPLATRLVDEQAVEMMRQWIAGLKE